MSTEPRDTVHVVRDGAGWRVRAVVGGALFTTPEPVSAAAAAGYLRLLLPHLTGSDDEALLEQLRADRAEADR